jgi:pyridinium-3,5-biscarboxylic acid mononucleotide synthase
MSGTGGLSPLEKILEQVRRGELTIEAAEAAVRNCLYEDVGHTKLDVDRPRRTGFPEVIYCAGKTEEQLADIFAVMREKKLDLLGTRLEGEMWDKLATVVPEAEYNPLARTVTLSFGHEKKAAASIAVIAAGTSDLPVAEEAAVTAEFFGNPVQRYSDVGVAGIHRLMTALPEIRKARVVIAVAGMEGALGSVVAGLVDKPVIAVPTSVGYGASFGGLSALLAMLNSCAPGISVVNIDNGFGAGYMASQINRL